MKTKKSSHHPDVESLTDLQLLDEIVSFFARLTVFSHLDCCFYFVNLQLLCVLSSGLVFHDFLIKSN